MRHSERIRASFASFRTIRVPHRQTNPIRRTTLTPRDDLDDLPSMFDGHRSLSPGTPHSCAMDTDRRGLYTVFPLSH